MGHSIPLGWFFSDFWHDQLVSTGRQYLFLLFVGFIGSFGFIRLSARLMRSPRVPWWPGSVVSDGGVHLHHLVWGIGAMMVSGVISFALFSTGFWYDVCAVFFGIGMGLTIDEFALWIHLDDVYWSREGRSSIDASVIAIAFMGVILVGGYSVTVDLPAPFNVLGTIVWVVGTLVLCMICFLKQRVFHGAIGLILVPIALYGAVRLGKPNSPWAHHRYGERHRHKQERAEHRFRPDRRTDRVKDRVRDLIGGVTGDEYAAQLAKENSTTETASKR
jgi:hypothetical protein